jgi:hypothetical protein
MFFIALNRNIRNLYLSFSTNQRTKLENGKNVVKSKIHLGLPFMVHKFEMIYLRGTFGYKCLSENKRFPNHRWYSDAT